MCLCGTLKATVAFKNYKVLPPPPSSSLPSLCLSLARVEDMENAQRAN